MTWLALLAVILAGSVSFAYTTITLIRQHEHLCRVERGDQRNDRALAARLHMRLPVTMVPGC